MISTMKWKWWRRAYSAVNRGRSYPGPGTLASFCLPICAPPHLPPPSPESYLPWPVASHLRDLHLEKEVTELSCVHTPRPRCPMASQPPAFFLVPISLLLLPISLTLLLPRSSLPCSLYMSQLFWLCHLFPAPCLELGGPQTPREGSPLTLFPPHPSSRIPADFCVWRSRRDCSASVCSI